MATNKQSNGGLSLAAIMSLYFVSMAITVVTPAMATFAEHYPGKNISWISTLPTLFIVLGTAIAGSIMGKKIAYRKLAIIASIISLIGGIAPAFFDNFYLMLVCRGIMGFGMGLLAPLGNALILGLYEGQRQANYLGYGTLFMNGGGILMQMLGGALAGKGWQMVFWGHICLAVALVFAFFLPEPKAAAPQAGGQTKKESVASKVWLIAFLIFLYNVLAYPIMLNVSILFVQRDAGGAAAAATSLSMYTVAGVVAGLVFGQIFKLAKRLVLTCGYGLCGLGILVVYFGSSSIIMTIGLMMVGFGFSLILPSFMTWAGMITPPSTIPAASSIILAAMNLGGFVSSIWLSVLNAIFGENILSAMIIDIICCLALAAIFVIASPFKEKA